MSMKKFTIEGDTVLGYFADEMSERDRGVQIKSDETGDPTGIEALIARNLEFPSSEEFDQHFQRMEQLRSQELQPLDSGNPDITREGTRLRITVEVIDGTEDDD